MHEADDRIALLADGRFAGYVQLDVGAFRTNADARRFYEGERWIATETGGDLFLMHHESACPG